ncbi:MAG: diaminopimelate epimerase [Syntrophobacteraceae bacterium]
MSETRHRIRFTKMTGSGNDFIIIDNRALKLTKERGRELARLACRRKVSVGADGLILIENDVEADFRWQFFNADGSEAEMCGNGARCAARFARLKGIADKDRLSFSTLAGLIEAQVSGDRAKVRMPQPHGMEIDFPVQLDDCLLRLSFVNTGVPHAVFFADSQAQLDQMDVFERGRSIRFHQRFQPAGSNADFVFVSGPRHISVRTYERGVEAETLACGTGSIAAALLAAAKNFVSSPVEVLTMSGDTLVIHFEKISQEAEINFSAVYLEGDAKVVYDAELWDETLRK